MLRAGNAGSNTAADHIAIAKDALAQLPGHRPGSRPGRKVLIRTDGAGASHAFLDRLAGQRLSYSVGFGLPANTAELLTLIPADVWTPAYDAHDQIRDGAWVAELTGLLDLTGWPPGMRVIARKERPHPGAQLRITDADGLRVTAFATNSTLGQLPDLELRHRRRARAEDRIRCTKDTGLANCRCTTSRRTRSGAPSSRWPASSPRGCRCSPSSTPQPDGGSPNGLWTRLLPSRRPWPAPDAVGCSTWPTTTLGPSSSTTPPSGYAP